VGAQEHDVGALAAKWALERRNGRWSGEMGAGSENGARCDRSAVTTEVLCSGYGTRCTSQVAGVTKHRSGVTAALALASTFGGVMPSTSMNSPEDCRLTVT